MLYHYIERCLNPLAIGASDQTRRRITQCVLQVVSIPWQSGHLIRRREEDRSDLQKEVSIPWQSGHLIRPRRSS